MGASDDTQKATKSSTGRGTTSTGFSKEEREAMRERAKEVKAEARRGSRGKRDGESDLLAKIAEMTGQDKAMATRIHEIVKANAPDLEPKTWYGFPAYAKDGKVLCFFQPAAKFGERYASFGFNDNANLDAGNMWPTSFALKDLTAAEEKKLATLVKKAAR
jgi:uncharacterized protein YdhG (YjbR/CyaY superfamily)